MLRQLASLVLIDLHVVMVSIGVLFLLAGCSMGEYSSRHSADAQSSLDSFRTHVHPEFTAMRCNGCHIIKDDPPRLPAFADADIAIAHAAAEQIVNFNDVESSKFVTKQKSRLGHNCDKPSGECDANAQKLITALTAWKASRDSSAEESLLFTDEKDADQGETGDYTDHELKFAINKLIGTDTSGNVTLEVTVSKSAQLETLTLTNFKLSTTDEPIFLGGLGAKRNGRVSTDDTKKRICALVKPDEDDDTILTQFGEIVFTFAEGDSSPNIIALGLKNLRVATASDKCGEKTINSVDEADGATAQEN